MVYYIINYILIEFIFLLPILAIYVFFVNNINKKKFIILFTTEDYFPINAIKVSLYALLTVIVMWFSIVFAISWKMLVIITIAFFNIFACIYILYVFFIRKKDYKTIFNFIYLNFRFFLMGLIIFFILIVLRGFAPELATTEKPMDYSFIASLLRQSHLPAQNPWLFNFLLNYYYLGQFFSAIIIYLIRMYPWVGYNFVISLIASWAFVVLFELLELIFRKYYKQLYGNKKIRHNALIKLVLFLGTSIILFGGNIYYLGRIVADNINILFNRKIFHTVNFFYPESTRVIPYTINEYPAYSILLGDLHGHFVVLPFIYTFISLFIFSLYILNMKDFFKIYNFQVFYLKKIKYVLPAILLLAGTSIFIIGTNSWDVINIVIFVLLYYISFFLTNFKNKKNKGVKKNIILITYIYLLIGIFALIGFFPFLKYFLPPTDGIGFKINLDFKYYLPLFGHYLLFLFLVVFLVKQLRLQIIHITQKILPIISILISGLLLILATQLFYIKDIFYKTNAPYYRANTVFKIYYTSWSFLGISLISLFILLVFNPRLSISIRRFVIKFYIILSFLLISYFIIGAIQRFRLLDYAYIKQRVKSLGSINYLDGLKYTTFFDKEQATFVKELYINYPNSVFIEPIDYKSYSNTSKFCIYSGEFCYIGWPMHNMQWYGGFNGIGLYIKKDKYIKENVNIQEKVSLVQALYQLADLKLINKEKNMTNFHILVYRKPPFVISPYLTAKKLMRSLSKNKNWSCYMTYKHTVYDIYCKRVE